MIKTATRTIEKTIMNISSQCWQREVSKVKHLVEGIRQLFILHIFYWYYFFGMQFSNSEGQTKGNKLVSESFFIIIIEQLLRLSSEKYTFGYGKLTQNLGVTLTVIQVYIAPSLSFSSWHLYILSQVRQVVSLMRLDYLNLMEHLYIKALLLAKERIKIVFCLLFMCVYFIDSLFFHRLTFFYCFMPSFISSYILLIISSHELFISFISLLLSSQRSVCNRISKASQRFPFFLLSRARIIICTMRFLIILDEIVSISYCSFMKSSRKGRKMGFCLGMMTLVVKC